jgi:hypothetical protein
MKARKIRLLGIATGLVAMTGFFAATVSMVNCAVQGSALKDNDFTAVRKEALSLFPRGSRIADTADRLTDMGFLCFPVPHSIANVSSASLDCKSNGRGFPGVPAFNITVLTRNGLISDVEIWNVVDHADADTALPTILAVR